MSILLWSIAQYFKKKISRKSQISRSNFILSPFKPLLILLPPDLAFTYHLLFISLFVFQFNLHINTCMRFLCRLLKVVRQIYLCDYKNYAIDYFSLSYFLLYFDYVPLSLHRSNRDTFSKDKSNNNVRLVNDKIDHLIRPILRATNNCLARAQIEKQTHNWINKRKIINWNILL